MIDDIVKTSLHNFLKYIHKYVFRICVEYIIQPYKTSENFNLSNQ